MSKLSKEEMINGLVSWVQETNPDIKTNVIETWASKDESLEMLSDLSVDLVGNIFLNEIEDKIKQNQKKVVRGICLGTVDKNITSKKGKALTFNTCHLLCEEIPDEFFNKELASGNIVEAQWFGMLPKNSKTLGMIPPNALIDVFFEYYKTKGDTTYYSLDVDSIEIVKQYTLKEMDSFFIKSSKIHKESFKPLSISGTIVSVKAYEEGYYNKETNSRVVTGILPFLDEDELVCSIGVDIGPGLFTTINIIPQKLGERQYVWSDLPGIKNLLRKYPMNEKMTDKEAELCLLRQQSILERALKGMVLKAVGTGKTKENKDEDSEIAFYVNIDPSYIKITKGLKRTIDLKKAMTEEVEEDPETEEIDEAKNYQEEPEVEEKSVSEMTPEELESHKEKLLEQSGKTTVEKSKKKIKIKKKNPLDETVKEVILGLFKISSEVSLDHVKEVLGQKNLKVSDKKTEKFYNQIKKDLEK